MPGWWPAGRGLLLGGRLMNATAGELSTARPGTATTPSVRRRRKAPWVISLVIVLAAAGIWVTLAKPFDTKAANHPGVVDNADPTGLATVTRQDLSAQTQVSATLGYAGDYSVVNQARGTLTALPQVGDVLTQGQVVYRVDGKPVVLLYGTTPAYRSLAAGALASDVTGTDVKELNADLVTLGYVTKAELPAGADEFTWATTLGVEKLQAELDVTKTGALGLGDVVFEPGPVRVTAVSATLGSAGQPGQSLLSATATTRQVSIALPAGEQTEVKTGNKVTVTLPNSQTTPGVISSIGTVATTPSGTQNASPTITVLVTPTDPAATGTWDQAPVSVTISTGSVQDALVVPVDALLAQTGGSYAVEVVGTDGLHHLVPVSLGVFDDADGLVQVTNTQLSAGQRIVVPSL